MLYSFFIRNLKSHPLLFLGRNGYISVVPPKFINFSLYFLIFTFKYKVINLFIVLTVQPLLPNFYSCWIFYIPIRTVPMGLFKRSPKKWNFYILHINGFQPRPFSLSHMFVNIYTLLFIWILFTDKWYLKKCWVI